MAKGVQGGREYVERQRQIEQRKKQLMVEEQDLRNFETLIKHVDALRLPEDAKTLLKLSGEIGRSMDAAHAQALKRLAQERSNASSTASNSRENAARQRAATNSLPEVQKNADDHVSSMTRRVDRMGVIIREVRGLEHWMASGETEVTPRYRHLLHEFADLMREANAAMAAAIAKEEKDLVEGRWN
jgi:hypothetical protein